MEDGCPEVLPFVEQKSGCVGPSRTGTAFSVWRRAMILPDSPNVQKLVALIEGREISPDDELQLIQGLSEAFKFLSTDERPHFLRRVEVRLQARDANELSGLREVMKSFYYFHWFYLAYSERGKKGERAAYIEALGVLITGKRDFMHRYGLKNDCDTWFKDLEEMLRDLDDGIVSPLLDCQARSNALPSTTWLERTAAVLAIEVLCLLDVKVSAAAQRVIDAMPGLGASEGDILSWRAHSRRRTR